MLRSQSIHKDKIPANRRKAKAGSDNYIPDRYHPDRTNLITYFYGISHGSNTLADHLLKSYKHVTAVHINEFLYKGYQPPHDVAVWGILRGGEQVIRWAKENNRNYYYFDNPYLQFNKSPRTVRLTKNESQITQYKDVSRRRMDKMFPPLLTYKESNSEKIILVCPPGDGMVQYWNLYNWLEDTLSHLKSVTNRPIEVRFKPSPIRVYRKSNGLLDTWEDSDFSKDDIEPLSSVLERTHAVVTFNSTVSFEALRQGIPVFCAPTCSASLLGNTDLTNIENPQYTDRTPLFATLAYSQWTMKELHYEAAWKYT